MATGCPWLYFEVSFGTHSDSVLLHLQSSPKACTSKFGYHPFCARNVLPAEKPASKLASSEGMAVPFDQMMWWYCFQQEQDRLVNHSKQVVLLPVASFESLVIKKDVGWDF